MSATVMTVTGPVPANELGFTLIHEHIFLDLRNDVWLSDRMLNDPDLAHQELMRYKDAGGVTLVDQTPGGLRGNTNRILPTKHPLAIREIAERTGLNIVLGCGWYREPYYEPYLWRATTNQIADEIIADVTEGIEGTDVKAGLIGEIGAHANHISPVEERVLRAAARAQKATGVSLSTHQSEGNVALTQLDILEEEGVDLQRVICSHSGGQPDHEYHIAIAERGAYVSFEGLGSRNPVDAEREMRSMLQLIEAGHIDRMLLSHDVCVKPMYACYGGSGYGFIPQTWLGLMKERGVTDEQINRLMIDNPRRALTGE
jgi:predicted metal-dependent phosphotriesterase family hydrolase